MAAILTMFDHSYVVSASWLGLGIDTNIKPSTLKVIPIPIEYFIQYLSDLPAVTDVVIWSSTCFFTLDVHIYDSTF